MRRCPYCAEEIQEEAIKCRHCGSTLTGRDTASLDASLRAGGPGPASRYDTLDMAVTQSGHANILGGQYRIVKKLGEGGMGIVYLAEDMELADRSVAIKVLRPVLSGNARAVENLRREALTVISLNHPHIIRLYGFHSDEEIKFLVMEYIEGKTLEEVLTGRPDHRLGFEECVRIIEQVAGALDHAHSQKPAVVHRDLKPSNIMMDKAGGVKVLDFGIAREMKDSYTRVTGQQTSGTLPYMSPEQLRGKGADPEMDIYALGAVCYECLSGRTPFHTGDVGYQIIHEPPPLLEGVPPHVNEALRSALAKEPRDRPQSAGQLAAALKGGRAAVGEPKSQTRPQVVASRPLAPHHMPETVPGPVGVRTAHADPTIAGPAGRQKPRRGQRDFSIGLYAGFLLRDLVLQPVARGAAVCPRASWHPDPPCRHGHVLPCAGPDRMWGGVRRFSSRRVSVRLDQLQGRAGTAPGRDGRHCPDRAAGRNLVGRGGGFSPAGPGSQNGDLDGDRLETGRTPRNARLSGLCSLCGVAHLDGNDPVSHERLLAKAGRRTCPMREKLAFYGIRDVFTPSGHAAWQRGVRAVDAGASDRVCLGRCSRVFGDGWSSADRPMACMRGAPGRRGM